MTRASLRLLVFVSGTILLAGCLPDDMPAYVNDGKTIVVKAGGPYGDVLWTYDVQSKTATAHPPPEKQELQSARMLGDQVWVQWAVNENVSACKRFDPLKNEFLPGPPELDGRNWLSGAIPASYEGKKCLFIPARGSADAEGKIAYDVFSFPELKKQKTVSLNQVIPAGRFWWVTLKVKEGGQGWGEIEHVEHFNAEGKQVVSILRDEGRKMTYTPGKFPGYARTSDDGSALLLAFGDQGCYNFGVFDAGSGKFLWGGATERGLRGNPLVKKTEVWSLEQTEDVKRIALVRHRPGEKTEGPKGKRETIVTYPAADADPFHDQFTPSPDGSHFVMLLTGTPPRLLFIPIKEGVTEKDVRCVELKEAGR